MASRVPVAVLVLLAGWTPAEAAVAPGAASNTVGAAMKCCPLLKQNRMGDFGQCVTHFGVVPICGGDKRGCSYGNKLYPVDSTVQLIPSKCLKIVCTAVTVKSDMSSMTQEELGQVVASGTETAQLQMKQVSKGCGCCEYQGELYANGSWLHKDHSICIRSECINGIWKDVGNEYQQSQNVMQDDRSMSNLTERSQSKSMRASSNNNGPTCCFHEGRYYFEGETIALYNKSYGSNCEKLVCLSGHVKSCFFQCCCIEGNEIYPCYTEKALPSSDFETCTIRRCCDGFIHEHREPGCCSVDGQVYRSNEEIGYTDDGCQLRRCIEGQVVLEDAQKCCYVNDHYVQSGKVVESNPEKCIFKICENVNVLDFSLDTCPCCLYNSELYRNGSSIERECVQLTCVDGAWKEEEHDCCDFCQIHTGTNYLTFDGTSYYHNGLCNVTLVQDHYYGYSPDNFIALSFKTCGLPFTEKATCNNVLTIKHNYHTVVTLSPGEIIKVNGRTITELPYGENHDLFIWETAFTYRVLTFDDLVVEYGKSASPLVRVFTPDKNKGKLYGICGHYDGSVMRDLRPRNAFSFFFAYPTEFFYNSWKTREPCCSGIIEWEEACAGVSNDRIEYIKDLCEAKITCGTDCGHDSLGAEAVQERCLSDLCYCRPGFEQKCLVSLEEELIHLCSSIGGNLYLQCPQGGNISLTSMAT